MAVESYDETDYAFTREDLRGDGGEPAYSGATSFMRRKYTRDLAGVDLAVIGVPYDLAVTNRPGTRFGPRAIRQASSIMGWDPALVAAVLPAAAADPFQRTT